MGTKAEISPQEAVALSEHDGAFFGEYFFPKTFRNTTPDFLRTAWDELDDINHRQTGFEIFRGGAKTTLLRGYTAKRISYGLTRTAMYIGKSEPHALRSLAWIMKQVEFNRLWAGAYGLRPGKPWNTEACCIIHDIFEIEINLIAMGIFGSTRGVNIDDYRPDFILLDDVLDDDNAATVEQRNKINARIFGAIVNSLAPENENPTAKIVMIQTPIDRDDASALIQKDPDWHTMQISCFDSRGESTWPERWSTEQLHKMKEGYRRKNMLSLWLREMECKVVADEKRHFRATWLNYWVVTPEKMTVCIAIDPSPPKDEDAINRAKKEPDPEVVMAIGRCGDKYYILDYIIESDPNPDKTITSIAFLVRKWNALFISVETVAYQKTLSWYIGKAMEDGKIPHMIVNDIDDKRSKVKRIRHNYTSVAPSGNLHIRKDMTDFYDQFNDYPDVSHDDVLDCGAVGIQSLRDFEGAVYEGEFSQLGEENSTEEPLRLLNMAP